MFFIQLMLENIDIGPTKTLIRNDANKHNIRLYNNLVMYFQMR